MKAFKRQLNVLVSVQRYEEAAKVKEMIKMQENLESDRNQQ